MLFTQRFFRDSSPGVVYNLRREEEERERKNLNLDKKNNLYHVNIIIKEQILQSHNHQTSHVSVPCVTLD